MNDDATTDAGEYECVKCDYKTCRKSSWNKHVITKKHIGSSSNERYECDICEKSYKDKSGLWRHTKTCVKKNSQEADVAHLTVVIVDQNKIIVDQNKIIMAQNKEIVELAKLGVTNAGNNANAGNNNTNSNNTNHFNLQFFLNETCKDALNLKDFIKTIVIELSDLKNIQTLGYTDGMSAIISNALDSLDTNKRPIHCSDVKRETMYVKEGDVWEKENEDRTNMKDMIRSVEHKNIIKMPEWVKDNPGCVKSDHKDNTTYLKMMTQVTGGDLTKSEDNVDKIIHKIAKNVIIDKTS